MRPESRGVRVRSFSNVQPEQVSWLWPGRIPYGMLSLIDGETDIRSILWLSPMREVPDKVAHVASLYDVRVHVRQAEGNPIRPWR